ncbi:MAG: xanthine dehydrogenase family protein molybdopterin-binding subunit, partial [Proteobacteria bacterium]
ANQNRRQFLSGSLALTGGLVVSFYLPGKMGRALGAEPAKAAAVYPPNAFIQIAPDNSITIVINRLEMGQGVNTSMAQLIAEELECDWKSIRSVSAPVNPVYNAVGMPIQMTGGSNALRTSWEQHRLIGASMREMLKSAAAARWNVSVKDVRAENGFILNSKNDQKFSYGDLAESAAKLPLPQNPPLKSSKNFKFIGKSVPRTDALEKSNGKAIFGIDVKIPGMLYVAIARPSLESANLVSFNAKAASQVKGVSKVVRFGNKVAVLATNTHIARKACDLLVLKWDNGVHKNASDQSFMANFKDAGKKTGFVTEERGQVEAEMKKAKNVISMEYEFPFLAHATMEPMNCTVRFDGKTADIWSGHQMPTSDLMAASKALGLAPERINVQTVYAGGSFGRRASKTSDYVVEACTLAKIVKKPIKVVWSREDDMRGGYYRPMNYHKVTLGLDEKNNLLSWDHHVIGQSIIKGSPFEAFMPGPVEEPVVEGVHHTSYKLPTFRCQQTLLTTPVQSLWWRSVGNTHTAYVMETVIDELAEKSGKDVFEYRRKLLKDSPRHLAILDILEKKLKANQKSFTEGRAWGLAIHESFESVVGHLVDVSMVNGHPKVHRVWSAVHCGQVVNPETAKTQVEGGIVYGLSSLWQQIQVRDGEIVQKNYDTFPVMRIQDMPQVEVEFVPSNDPPTGLGEPGVPPAAPAVANAMYKLTQKRLRVLPFSPDTKG